MGPVVSGRTGGRHNAAVKATLTTEPIATVAVLRAAPFWADARCRGQPTADPKDLAGDVILAAQAIRAGAVVATENVGRLSRYVPAYQWSAILLDPPGRPPDGDGFP